MVDNIPPEELEIELSGRQIEQLDAIDNTVYQTILTFLNKTKLTRCVGGKLEFYDFLFFKKSIVLFTINTIHIKPTIPQTIESFKSANPPVYCIA